MPFLRATLSGWNRGTFILLYTIETGTQYPFSMKGSGSSFASARMHSDGDKMSAVGSVGSELRQRRTARDLKLESTFRSPGRPKEKASIRTKASENGPRHLFLR